jgi:hypothetical protein
MAPPYVDIPASITVGTLNVHCNIRKAHYADVGINTAYREVHVFWVPKEARWSHLQANAKQPTIGKLIDEAMTEIQDERHEHVECDVKVFPYGCSRNRRR